MELSEIQNLRNDIPALSGNIYLNTGTAGPLNRKVITRMKAALDDQLVQGRINLAYYHQLDELKAETRNLVASYISCSQDEVTLTRATSEGLSIVINGLDLPAGSEIITTNGEHITAYSPIYNLQKKGVSVKLLDVLEGYDKCLEQLEKIITGNTRLLCLSEVIYCSGDRIPVEEICRLAKERGIPVLIDGAQSFGAFKVNVKEMGCEFFTAPGQKWICGPEGTGFLYVSEEVRHLIDPLFTGYSSVKEFGFDKGVYLHEDGRRFESGTYQPADLAGFNEALKWHAGFDIKAMAARSYSLCNMFEKQLYHPDVNFINHGITSSLVSFKVKGIPSDNVVAHLFQKGITVRPVPVTDAVRLSIGFFNTEEEVKQTAEELLRLIE